MSEREDEGTMVGCGGFFISDSAVKQFYSVKSIDKKN